MITIDGVEKVLMYFYKVRYLPIERKALYICNKRKKIPCGTLTDVAGNYWLAKHWDGRTEYPKDEILVSEGNLELANDLELTNHWLACPRWAHNHPEIWGNKHGKKMFFDGRAYGLPPGSFLMEDVIMQWEAVRERLERGVFVSGV